ncbi:unnamed protein product [Lactuca saligna]|uniref:Uncharacterized protein n=1 Tax=Lactuca saligna TaxID=75948 RepID=A0AA35V5B1_LACSI|nr:unnamed protein product [Lactuca saligna]
MFPIIRENAAIQQNRFYPHILRWFHVRRLNWEGVCDVFNVDEDEAHQPKRKMIASDVECSTPNYFSYITSLKVESSEVPSSVRFNFRKNGASSSDLSCENNHSTRSTERTHTVGINKRTTREILARLQSLEEEIQGMKNKGGVQKEDDLETYLDQAFEGNDNVDASFRMLSPMSQQFGSERKSSRINEDDELDNQPKLDCRKQKQIVKKRKKKKKVVDSDIVDAKNHIPEPPIQRPSRPARKLNWEGVCDVFIVDEDEAHQPKRKMIASDVECSTPNYFSYITSLKVESSEVPSSVRFNFRKNGASSSDLSCENNHSTQSTERTHTVGINKRTTREILARLQSLEEEIQGMKNKGGVQKEDDLETYLDQAFEGNDNVDASFRMLSPMSQQFGSERKSSRVNEDDELDNQPKLDCRKQKQIVKKKKKKKKVVDSDIVDANNHIPEPPIQRPSRPARKLNWEGDCDVFNVDEDEAHQPKRKMIVSDVECSTPNYFSYITSLKVESSEVPSSVRFNFRKNGNGNVDASFRMPSPMSQQFGSERKSSRVNEDDELDNQPKLDCRKQKQIVKKKKKKKKVVDSDIVDANNHIPEPPIQRPSRPASLLKPSQYLSSPYISLWMDTLSLSLYDNLRSFGTVNIIDFVRFEELMDHMLLDIGYWNHMDLTVQKASITVTNVP